jgi:hypothetical protein
MVARSFKRQLYFDEGRQGHEPHRMRTDFLFPMPSFWSGMGSVLDWLGTIGPYNYSPSEVEADFKALYSDYRMTGQDIEDAMKAFEARYAEVFSGQGRLFDPDEVKRVS